MKESPFFSRDIGGERKERKHGIRKFSGCSTEFDWLERPFLIQPAGRGGEGPCFPAGGGVVPFTTSKVVFVYSTSNWIRVIAAKIIL